jgi:ABC-type multidrug transport system ATPase subunit
LLQRRTFIGDDRLRQRVGSLSGGEQSMLKVARAVLCEPRLVLLDEINEGLQPITVDRVKTCLAAERQRGVSILLVEQNIDFACHLAQRYGLMGANRVIGYGSFEDPGRAASDRGASCHLNRTGDCWDATRARYSMATVAKAAQDRRVCRADLTQLSLLAEKNE